MRSRYCKVCGGFHNTEEPWPEACYGHFQPKASSFQIIKDIQPYKAVAIDKRTGKAPVITSRRAHREFLKNNGYVEVGNEPIRNTPEFDIPDSRREIKQTIDQIRSQGRWK